MKASTETITVRAAFSPRLSAALIRLESDLTFIEMEARMHYHKRAKLGYGFGIPLPDA
ncbi:MAG: hypothetical protein ABWZ17_08885 [Candidatus Binatia bacterium]